MNNEKQLRNGFKNILNIFPTFVWLFPDDIEDAC